jgi:hypothetical protein
MLDSHIGFRDETGIYFHFLHYEGKLIIKCKLDIWAEICKARRTFRFVFYKQRVDSLHEKKQHHLAETTITKELFVFSNLLYLKSCESARKPSGPPMVLSLTHGWSW